APGFPAAGPVAGTVAPAAAVAAGPAPAPATPAEDGPNQPEEEEQEEQEEEEAEDPEAGTPAPAPAGVRRGRIRGCHDDVAAARGDGLGEAGADAGVVGRDAPDGRADPQDDHEEDGCKGPS